MPNIALLPSLVKYFDKIYYFGGDGVEETIAGQYGIPYRKTVVVKFDRKRIVADLKIPFLLSKGIREATALFREIRPDIVFSKGGYAALPACFAAKRMGIPVVCHESDYTMGVANKIVSAFAAKTLTSFPETKGGTFVGNPVRMDFFRSKQTLAFPAFDPHKPILLVCGGSLGSVALNKVVYLALCDLLKQYNVLHVSGKNGDFSVHEKGYLQYAYSDDFPRLLQACDILVCRSGANTLAEAAALGKKCVTVPLPKGASRGDQLFNAKSYEKRGFCDVLPQENLTKETLLAAIEAVRYKVPPKADVTAVNDKIVQEIMSVLRA